MAPGKDLSGRPKTKRCPHKNTWPLNVTTYKSIARQTDLSNRLQALSQPVVRGLYTQSDAFPREASKVKLLQFRLILKDHTWVLGQEPDFPQEREKFLPLCRRNRNMVANLLTREVKSTEAHAVGVWSGQDEGSSGPESKKPTSRGHLQRFRRGFVEVRASLVSGLFLSRQMKLML